MSLVRYVVKRMWNRLWLTFNFSRGMPILAHNEKIMFFKIQVIMLYGIYTIKNYHYIIINTIIILRLKLYTHGCSTQSRRKCESNHWRGNTSEHYELWLYNLLMSFIKPRVKPIIIAQPFNKALISLLLYNLFYPKYVLLRLLKFLFIKRTLNFLSVKISYFICYWNGQLNLRNCKNLFRPSLSLPFINCFPFHCYSNMIINQKFGVKVLPPNLDINFFTPYFRFPYDLFLSVSFLLMNELYWSTSRSSTSTNFLVLLAEKYLNLFFLNSSIKSFNHTRFFFVFCRIELN